MKNVILISFVLLTVLTSTINSQTPVAPPQPTGPDVHSYSNPADVRVKQSILIGRCCSLRRFSKVRRC